MLYFINLTLQFINLLAEVSGCAIYPVSMFSVSILLKYAWSISQSAQNSRIITYNTVWVLEKYTCFLKF